MQRGIRLFVFLIFLRAEKISMCFYLALMEGDVLRQEEITLPPEYPRIPVHHYKLWRKKKYKKDWRSIRRLQGYFKIIDLGHLSGNKTAYGLRAFCCSLL